jgi:predicted nucleic acid-binding protein
MKAAFVDSSVIVAMALSESAAGDVRVRLRQFDRVFASRLLEAELASACRREDIPFDPRFLDAIEWVGVSHSLRDEIARVLDHGYLRGADCHHLATALYLSPAPASVTFVTFDARQQDVAQRLGFLV